MNDALLVRGLKRFRNLFSHRQEFTDRHCAAMQPVRESLSRHELEYEKASPRALLQPVDRSDVGVRERPDLSRGSFELLTGLRVHQKFVSDHPERNLPCPPGVNRFVENSNNFLTDFVYYPVVFQDRSGSEGLASRHAE